MNDALLLDTCCLLWMMGGERLTEESKKAIEKAASRDVVYVSPISAWEIALLDVKGRFALRADPEDWFAEAMRTPGFVMAELSVSVLVRSTNLPGSPPSDPADRILIATCRRNALAIVTRDRRILGYADHGHIAAVPC